MDTQFATYHYPTTITTNQSPTNHRHQPPGEPTMDDGSQDQDQNNPPMPTVAQIMARDKCSRRTAQRARQKRGGAKAVMGTPLKVPLDLYRLPLRDFVGVGGRELTRKEAKAISGALGVTARTVRYKLTELEIELAELEIKGDQESRAARLAHRESD